MFSGHLLNWLLQRLNRTRIMITQVFMGLWFVSLEEFWGSAQCWAVRWVAESVVATRSCVMKARALQGHLQQQTGRRVKEHQVSQGP